MDLNKEKQQLIDHLIVADYLKTSCIIEAFRKVPREKFIPEEMLPAAYGNHPLPIGECQTISQPLTVAAMTEALKPDQGQKILEIGAGSGYQAAILSLIIGSSGKVVTIERIQKLAEYARNNLRDYKNVSVVCGDGTNGHKNEAPYDRVIVTAAAPEVPEPLVNQLKNGGRMVIPVVDKMVLVEKNEDKTKETMLGNYVFVPLVGEHGYKD